MVFKIVGWVMRLAPIGTFGALASVVAKYGASSLQQLGYLILLFTGDLRHLRRRACSG